MSRILWIPVSNSTIASAPLGWFDESLVPIADFDPTLVPLGWFDEDQIVQQGPSTVNASITEIVSASDSTSNTNITSASISDSGTSSESTNATLQAQTYNVDNTESQHPHQIVHPI